ncbi:acyl-CoA carboxylase epsilon subunit [Streptomyces sp. NPDC015131]|uniref:acyl-CoA carboxylase epsilon subunit n=1 Tax=Streptomyces sp. NPDC015131 TaxID=3364941 RepID=UPI0036F515EB
MGHGPQDKDAPLFQVTRGAPGPEELAALATVLLARAAAPGAGPSAAPVAVAPPRPRPPRRRTRYIAPGAWRRAA